MRIVSLLPSLTELVFALGRGEDVVGVTHECDYPIDALTRPRLTRSRIESGASSAEIDAMVMAQGGSLYELDEEGLESLAPDLILTQAQCDVCAVNEAAVRSCAAGLPGSPKVESVNPMDLAGVYAMFRRVGDLLDARDRAEALVARIEGTALEIEARRQNNRRMRVVLLEWADPPYNSGHWNPDLVALAGGEEVLGQGGQAARRVSWSEVQEARPDALILAPCGYELERAERELELLERQPGWGDLPAVRNGRVVVCDGSSYFARPGPRLAESLAIVAAALDLERFAEMAPSMGWKAVAARS